MRSNPIVNGFRAKRGRLLESHCGAITRDENYHTWSATGKFQFTKWHHRVSFSVSSLINDIFRPECIISNSIFRAMLINPNIGKYLLLGSVAENKTYLDTIRIFYYQNVENLLEENGRLMRSINILTFTAWLPIIDYAVYFFLLEKDSKHTARETYWYSESYKLYGLIDDNNVLCLMTSSIIPTPTVRYDFSLFIHNFIANAFREFLINFHISSTDC